MDTNNCRLAFQGWLVVLALLLSFAVLAQTEPGRRSLDAGAHAGSAAESGQAKFFAVVPSTPATTGRAVQFRVHYDPQRVSVASTENCLTNLPDDLKTSGLNACRINREKNFVQVVISHLAKDGVVPAEMEIGLIEFERIASARNDNVVTIRDVHVTDPRGTADKMRVGLETIDY